MAELVGTLAVLGIIFSATLFVYRIFNPEDYKKMF
jgi:hypothetical protein